MIFNGSPVAIIGSGLIGQSWASLFLAKEAEVVICDSAPERAEVTRAFIEEAWPQLRALELTERTAPKIDFRFTTNIAEACDGAAFIQESGPERIEIKRSIIAEMEKTAGPNTVIASSTSSLLASDIQSNARRPHRILVGHPINPPHLVPAVDLVGGRLTDESSIETAFDVYRNHLERVVIRAQKEVVGHVINRLNSALYQEAVNLVAKDIASVEDVDNAIAYGLGLRWSLMGPHCTYHLGGGKGGYKGYLDHLAETQQARWASLGSPVMNERVKAKLVASLKDSLKGSNDDQLRRDRDSALIELLKLKKKFSQQKRSI